MPEQSVHHQELTDTDQQTITILKTKGATPMPNENLSHWPSGARDTTEFPKVNIDIDVAFRDHLKAFTKMGGAGWTDYDAMNSASGSEMTGSRLRTYRKLYEKCGLIYRADGKIQLSRLGQQMGSLEADLEAKKEEVLYALRATAIDILSRYQLRNPSDNDPLPDDCDILPAICIWKAMRQLDDKLHAEEINRVILRVMRMGDLDQATIILAIISEDDDERPQIPFFSKVALRYTRRRLETDGCKVFIKNIRKA